MRTLDRFGLPRLTSVAAFFDDVWAPLGLLRDATQDAPPKITNEIERAQRRAFHHALLYSEQVVINRSYWFNNRYLKSLWANPFARGDLIRLLTPSDKSTPPAVVTFLFGEDHPAAYTPTTKTAADARLVRRWRDFWKEAERRGEIDALKLSWDPARNGAQMGDMGKAFRQYFRDEAPGYVAAFARRFDLDAEDRRQLEALLGRVQALAAGEGKFDRTVLYEELWGEVTSRPDEHYRGFRPGDIAMKQVVDTRYGVNLSDFVDRSSLLGEDTPDRAILQQTTAMAAGAAPADAQLLAQLCDNFLNQPTTADVPYFDPATLSLSEVLDLRRLDSWKDYIAAAAPLIHADDRGLARHAALSPDVTRAAHEAFGAFWTRAPRIVSRLKRQEQTIQSAGLLFQVIGAGAQFADQFVEAGSAANRVLEVVGELSNAAAEIAEGVILLSYLPLAQTRRRRRIAMNKIPLVRVSGQALGDTLKELSADLNLRQQRQVRRIPDALGAEHRDGD